jgi:hypothetical protein
VRCSWISDNKPTRRKMPPQPMRKGFLFNLTDSGYARQLIRNAGSAVCAQETTRRSSAGMTRNATEVLPTRFRFASGEGAGANDDLAATLQARLRIIALVIAATMQVFFVLLSVKWLNAVDDDARIFAQVGRIIVAVPMLLCALVAWWLRKGRPRAVRRLRWMEVALIAQDDVRIGTWPSLLVAHQQSLGVPQVRPRHANRTNATRASARRGG